MTNQPNLSAIQNRTIVIDAVTSIGGKFDCITLMNFIRENEIQGRTFDHHDIAQYLEHLCEKNFIQRVGSNADGYIKYQF